MPTYRVFISGSNVIMVIDGQQGRYGFYVTRFVRARNGEEAKRIALDGVMKSQQLTHGSSNAPDDPAICVVESLEQLGPDESVPAKQPGFAFYPDELN